MHEYAKMSTEEFYNKFKRLKGEPAKPLGGREIFIIEMRGFRKIKKDRPRLHELARICEVSRERIRQIEHKAAVKLRHLEETSGVTYDI